ncbi:MAG: alkaline phosphatase [Kiritimatiellae bacterium]|nr:alkaline phosphatase [Kiritimatiellia bacterium]
MKCVLSLLLLIPFLAGAAPKNIIVMIPDGTGHASLTAARHVKGEPLTLDTAIYGVIETRSADNSVTDSAAAATAMACGERTYNGAVGVNSKRIPLRSISEWAKAEGKSVGIVTTDAITGATPGGFSAHVVSRSNASEILEQQIASGFDVFLGGGAKTLTDPLKQFMREKGYTLVTTKTEMQQADGKIFGLFSPGIMTAKVTLRDGKGSTEPTLPEMAAKALDVLTSNPNGFFLMIEGAQVDKGNHESDLPWATFELLEFDTVVKQILDWASAHPDTIVLIAPDHETGGLTLLNEPYEGARQKAICSVTDKGVGKPGDYFVHYSTTWHTGVDVFLAGNNPTCKPTRNCDMIGALAELSAETLPELQGKTIKEQGVYWLETADGKRLRAQRDAIFVKPTGKWYQR